jgi:tRNA-specific 2-thiouridylase
LNQAQLAKTLFPLGEITKREVRAVAQRHGLANHAKKDSTGICFIGERPFREFLSRYLPREPGEMQTPEGRVVGHHEGLMYYTLGQRKGLGIGGAGEAWYVAGKDLERNVLTVVQGHDHPALFKDYLTAQDLSWVSVDGPEKGAPLAAKTRYRQRDAACRIADISEKNCAVEFATLQWAITPGQSFVAYEGERCLGGGIIA